MSNPLFFDDQYFFQPGVPEKFLADGLGLYPRLWVLETFAASYVLLSKEVFWLRFVNLILHFAVALVLVGFLRELLRDLDKRLGFSVSVNLAVILAVALFVVHPLATFTHGYLIQRTILCATFFSLCSLFAFWRGLAGSGMAMLMSCVFFALAIYAKEHAIMLPCVATLLAVLRYRSKLVIGLPLRYVVIVLMVQALLALIVFMQLKLLLGAPYEMMLGEVLDGEISIDKDKLYPLSVLNQLGLFFRYIGLWFMPLPEYISVDVRAPFPLDYTAWPYFIGAASFVFYVVFSARLLLKGGVMGLLGFSMLAPSLLFFTEFAAVRFQEPFVLYRSYLWAPFFFIPVALVMRLLSIKVLVVLFFLFLCFFSGASFLRLKTYSHPVFVWQEAADVFEVGSASNEVFGGYRIYYNLGTELSELGFLESSISALNRAIELKPSYGWAWNNRGAVYLNMGMYSAAQTDFEMATKLLPGNEMPWRGVVQVLTRLGKKDELERAQKMLCVLAGKSDCGAVEAQHLISPD